MTPQEIKEMKEKILNIPIGDIKNVEVMKEVGLLFMALGDLLGMIRLPNGAGITSDLKGSIRYQKNKEFYKSKKDEVVK